MKYKFRVWKPHTSLKMKPGMYQVADLNWYDKRFQGNTGEVFYKGYKTSDYFEDVKIMLFTGYKDINGVEVYEGDVLQWNDPELERDPVIVIFEYGAFVIDGSAIWDYAKWIKKGKNKHPDPTYELEDLEVVGNIYENADILPEYLKKQIQK